MLDSLQKQKADTMVFLLKLKIAVEGQEGFRSKLTFSSQSLYLTPPDLLPLE